MNRDELKKLWRQAEGLLQSLVTISFADTQKPSRMIRLLDKANARAHRRYQSMKAS